MKNSLKKILGSQATSIGSWITCFSPEFTEMMSQFNFDWLTVDMEHSSMSLNHIQQLVRICQAKDKPVLVRVDENNPNAIKRVMDTGPSGVIVPMVKTKEDAQKAVASVKYPPQGYRGVGYGRAQGYGLAFNEYKQWLKDESVVIVIIEHIDAIKNLDEILSVDGVDASMIGPYDLSGSMGFPGEFERDEVKSLLPKYLECQLRQAIFESLTAEYAARRVAMIAASENAEEIIDDLTQVYNKARQEAITKELLEVISGSEAMAG